MPNVIHRGRLEGLRPLRAPTGEAVPWLRITGMMRRFGGAFYHNREGAALREKRALAVMSVSPSVSLFLKG